MRIAVDVLGGDHAPDEILKGVAEALLTGEFAADELLLVGPRPIMEQQLGELGVESLPHLLHTEQVIEGHEKPVEGLRSKPEASIVLCVGAVREKKADGLIAFGNTGATVAAATMGLGMLPGIRRPGIAVVLHGRQGPFTLLDAGANPAPKPNHLFQYGLMGASFASDVLGIEQPRVALLNIGGEAGKGSPLLKEAYALLQEAPVQFNGNIEGNHLFFGEADVVVADGFAGNMVLKVVEGFAEYLTGRATEASRDAGEGLRNTIRQLFGAADYAEVGGASLLGVNGTVLIGHGRSKASAVLPALRAVRKDIEKGVNRHITERIAESQGNSASTSA
ncbi:MAG: phosphate acyltransferase PlsX [Planctomycetes bacterium]|nr:phosphate acyltransferase PlsX [Planctomycetota bacterium]